MSLSHLVCVGAAISTSKLIWLWQFLLLASHIVQILALWVLMLHNLHHLWCVGHFALLFRVLAGGHRLGWLLSAGHCSCDGRRGSVATGGLNVENGWLYGVL